MPQYYCHRCLRSFDIDESAAIACTRCRGEFVELVNRPAMLAAAMPGGFQALHQIADILRDGIANEFRGQAGQQPQPGQQPQQAQQQNQGAQQDDPPRAAAGGGAGAQENNTIGLEEFIRNMFRAEPRAEPANVTISFQLQNGAGVHIQAQRGGNNEGPPIPQFVGNINPEERLNLETAMQDILAQFQGEGGAAQAGFSEADINEFLPMKKVSQEHIDKGAQCTTCFDTFKLGEDVGALDCNHIFHRPCIEPWLKTKNSCPVCRQKVNMVEWKKNHNKRAQEAVLEDLD
ncbi:unnamed protein product [Caenorhabditis brenneri]